jgi:hypothetical protein
MPAREVADVIVEVVDGTVDVWVLCELYNQINRLTISIINLTRIKIRYV